MPDPNIDSFTLSFCSLAEQSFIRGCDYLSRGMEERARRSFSTTTGIESHFMDAWFMLAFIALVNSKPEEARQFLLRILNEDAPFHGQYILRFLPNLRMQVNLWEDFAFQVMPTTGDAAAIAARIYLIQNRPREAKKIIHTAFKKYQDNPVVSIVWAETMIADKAPDQVIEEIDKKIFVHDGKSDLDLLLTHLIGQAHLDLGDYRSGIYHWEGMLSFTREKNPRLTDRFKILLGKAYESKGYLQDAFDVYSSVEDQSMYIDADEEVSFLRGKLIEKIKSYKSQGIVKPLRFTEVHQIPRERPAQGYLELDHPGGAPAY
jgi:tetratricopeptide (TPR) repeat protein